MRKSISYRTLAAAVSIPLILLLSGVLIKVSMNHSREVTTSLTNDLVASHADVLKGKLNLLAIPLMTILDTLAFADYSYATLDKNDPVWLGTIAKVLAHSPHLTTLYFGDVNGNSILVRPIYDRHDWAQLNAPENAVLMVDHNPFKGGAERIFFDAKMTKISAFPHDNKQYDPRTRPWFTETTQGGEINITEPYYFYLYRHIGITFSRQSLDNKSVIAADFTLGSLNKAMQALSYSPNSKTLLFTEQGNLLAANQLQTAGNTTKLISLNDLGLQEFVPDLSKIDRKHGLYQRITWRDKSWQLIITPMEMDSYDTLYLVNLISMSDLLANSDLFRSKLIYASIIIVFICLIIVISATNYVINPLTVLVRSLNNIQYFNFRRRPYQRSGITEIDSVNEAMLTMETVLLDFFHTLKSVARSTEPQQVSQTLVTQVQEMLSADGCLLFTNSPQARSEFGLAASIGCSVNIDLKPLFDCNPAAFALPIYELTPTEIALIASKKHSCILMPLMNRSQQNNGALLICFKDKVSAETRSRLNFVHEFTAFNEIVLEHLEAMEEQTNLFHSFVKMTASAVDVKSAYTGEHCKRVPELTKLFAEQVVADKQDFADFKLDKKQWEELLLAAWLHDCGKVSTPDFIMDKSTKLETVYDRIHEVRMRYEVLCRDADIAYWQAINNGSNPEETKAQCTQLKQTLSDEFAFIAECNLGSELMEPNKIERLNQIAKRTWLRTLPDNIGIYQPQRDKQVPQSLPAVENVLADKPEHLCAWADGKKLPKGGVRDFKIQPPEYQYNRGECYNLAIQTGTLTNEERYRINEHVVQTYIMLDRLPYPKHLKNLPIIAGSHHERIDGTGYPLQLKGKEIPLQGRILAIADVFEALTAADRPYKEAKTLSFALTIMANMAKDQHLDIQLFDLFLRSEVYLDYAQQYLSPAQIDTVDVAKLRRIYQ